MAVWPVVHNMLQRAILKGASRSLINCSVFLLGRNIEEWEIVDDDSGTGHTMIEAVSRQPWLYDTFAACCDLVVLLHARPRRFV